MIVENVMSTRLITVQPDETIGHAAQLLRHHRIHQIPVVRMRTNTSDLRLIWQGLVTDEDIERAAALA
jgi:acetoin utilization protein AcuB